MTQDGTNPRGAPATIALSHSLCRLVGVEPLDENLAYVNAGTAAKGAALASVDGQLDLTPVFDLAEAILDHGSGEQRDLIVVGFLEDLQNYALRGDGNARRILDGLGPKSSQAWLAIEELWQGNLLALDEFFESLGPDAEARSPSPDRRGGPGP